MTTPSEPPPAPIPAGPPSPAPPGFAELADHLVGWLTWCAFAAGTVGLLGCLGLALLGRRQRGRLVHEGLVGTLWVLGGMVLASVAALLAGSVAGVGGR
ncbi:MAG TPA: hypothetical protein VGH99_19970 [Pseudonocardia sp.]|jgi:hypothetical protein